MILKQFFLSPILLCVVISAVADGQERPQVTEIVDGVQVAREGYGEYDDLPKSTRAQISRERYEKMISRSPTAEEIVREVVSDNQKRRVKARNSITSFSQAMVLFDTFKSSPELLKGIEITDAQISDFNRIKTSFLKEKIGKSQSEMQLLELEFARKALGLFMPFQMEQMSNWNVARLGVSKILTETQIGVVVSITEAQKKLIREKSQKIADEIREFEKQKREEIRKIAIDVLSKKQQIKLKKIVVLGDLDKAIEETSLPDLENQLDYRLKETSKR